MDIFRRYQKLFLALGFALTVGLLGFALYYIFFRPALPGQDDREPAGRATTTVTGGLPAAQTGQGNVVTDTEPGGRGLEPAETKPSEVARGGVTETKMILDTGGQAIALTDQGAMRYYDSQDGKFYERDRNGQMIALSDKAFKGVENVTWSPNDQKAVLEFPDGANIVYDFATKRQVTLPKHWEEFSFSPEGSQLAFKSLGLDPANRWLAVANTDGSQAKAIEPLGENADRVVVAWSPNHQVAALYGEGTGFDRQEVYFLGLNKENFKSMTVEGRDFRPLWSDTGQQLLYSVYSSNNDMKPMLWLANSQGDEIGSGRKSLGLETWADKCVFGNGSEAYCAVPERLEEGSGMMPDLAKGTIDRLYKIDTQTGLKKLVAIPEGEHNISQPVLSADNTTLYFTDENDQRVYAIKLK